MVWFRDLKDSDFYRLKKIFLENNLRIEFDGRNSIGVEREDLIYLIQKVL